MFPRSLPRIFALLFLLALISFLGLALLDNNQQKKIESEIRRRKPIHSGISQKCDQIANEDRFDCHPEYGANQNECIKRGCCWRAPSGRENSQPETVNRTRLGMDVPYCYYPGDFPSYQVVSQSRMAGNDGIVLSLQKSRETFRPNEILKLEVRIHFETNRRLHVQIVDPNNERYQVPVVNINQPYQQSKYDAKDNNTDYQISINKSPFALKIYRKSTGKLL